MDESTGTRLKSLLSSAQHEVLIVAPFIKLKPFERLISEIPDAVKIITCVTRWLPEDVAAGVSDLSVLDAVRARQGAKLLLHARLHAKLFRADNVRLVGSANISDRALGWSTKSNLELLVSVSSAERDQVEKFETQLIANAIAASDELREIVQLAADRLPPSVRATSSEGDNAETADDEPWIPTCASPDQLWSIYADDSDAWRVINSAQRAGRTDLMSLGIPNGLPKPIFDQFIRSTFVSSAVVTEVDGLAERGLSLEEGARLIRSFRPSYSEESATAAFQILMRWMEYFRPNIYRRTSASEIFHKGRELN